jgi:ElaB/YqjD/DUF883 family membrane-anchored ribosome-binding protein
MDSLQDTMKKDADDIISPVRDGIKSSTHAAAHSRTAKKVQRQARKIEDDLRDDADEVNATVQHFIRAIGDKSKTARENADQAVHNHPYAAAGIAFGIGVLIAGVLLNRPRS